VLNGEEEIVDGVVKVEKTDIGLQAEAELCGVDGVGIESRMARRLALRYRFCFFSGDVGPEGPTPGAPSNTGASRAKALSISAATQGLKPLPPKASAMPPPARERNV
jgi:hypothetical protein